MFTQVSKAVIYKNLAWQRSAREAAVKPGKRCVYVTSNFNTPELTMLIIQKPETELSTFQNKTHFATA